MPGARSVRRHPSPVRVPPPENREGRPRQPTPMCSPWCAPGMPARRRRSGRCARRRANLVEARTAVDGPIVTRGERNDRLPPAHRADCGVVLPWPPRRPRISGRLPTTGAPLRVVLQTFGGKERLLACGKGEFRSAIATGKRAILVHLLCSPSSGDTRGRDGPGHGRSS